MSKHTVLRMGPKTGGSERSGWRASSWSPQPVCSGPFKNGASMQESSFTGMMRGMMSPNHNTRSVLGLGDCFQKDVRPWTSFFLSFFSFARFFTVA